MNIGPGLRSYFTALDNIKWGHVVARDGSFGHLWLSLALVPPQDEGRVEGNAPSADHSLAGKNEN